MASVPNEVLDQILDRIDIAELIGEYIEIKKSGRNFKALCPFHKEKTPSFMISPDKGIYHCFGCGAGGNALNFLMRHDGMGFREAVKVLSDKTNIPLPSFTPEEKERESYNDALFKVNELAGAFFSENLEKTAEGKSAYSYLINRGLDDTTIKTFRLGYARKAWDGLLNHFKEKKIDLILPEKVGLILPGKSDGYYDRFRDRIIFPIFDLRGRTLGFGARVLDDSLPKYINSPETPIYTKGRHLYGLNLAKDHIKKSKYAVIVEGYMDLIMPYKFGIANVVATLGTALTTSQIRLLKRYANTVVLVYDPDLAGQEASLRGLELMVEEDMDVRIATLPPETDPDNFVKGYGRDAFYEVIKKSKNIFDYKLKALAMRFNIEDLRSKAKIASLMLPTIARIKNAVLKSGYLRRLAEKLSVPEEALREELKKVKTDYVFYGVDAPARDGVTKMKVRHAESLILNILFEFPEFMDFVREKINLEEFREPVVRQVFEEAFNFCAAKKPISVGHFLNAFSDEEARSFISEAASLTQAISDRQRILSDCIKRIKDTNLKEDLATVQSEIKKAELEHSEEKVRGLLSEYDRLLKKLQG